jgi:hypothetical protein
MSYAAPMYLDSPATETISYAAPAPLAFVQRSRMQWIPFTVPALMTFISWQAGGIPPLTDLAFLMFTAFMLVFLTLEFYYFPRRFGIGGLVLWGGTLTWFCQDYFVHWFHKNFSLGETYLLIPPATVAKAAFMLITFTMVMSIGLGIRAGRWAERLLLSVPDVDNSNFYFLLVIVMFVVGISPWYLFNAEPAYLCLLHAFTSGWTGSPAMTVGRTGSVNYNWGGYAAQLIQIGQGGGVFAAVYAVLIGRKVFDRLIAVCIWALWLCYAFQSSRRGEIAFMFMPGIALLFIKYQARAAKAFKRYVILSYVLCGVLTFVMYFMVQWQGEFRGLGLNAGSVETVTLGKNEGNTMFSESLEGYMLIGETKPVFWDSFPGEGALLAIPRTVYWFAIGPVPRALWNSKPIDPLWQWYNHLVAGGNGITGTTISHGLAGSWYFNYGFAGMVEGALLVGWLMGVAERTLQHSDGRPVGIMMSLGFAVWLFRTYRDFIFVDLYGLIITAVVLTILTYALRPYFSTQSAQQSAAAA